MAAMSYDVFLSYRRIDPDRTFARHLLEKLEATGLRAAIDERDFRPEATFLEEMERCIRESRFTLALLSPRYFESGNATEEAIICKVLDMSERRRRLIPLVLDAVMRPVWLYDIVGIDFTDPNPLVDPFERLLRTLSSTEDRWTSSGERAVSIHRLPVTGEVFVGREQELAQLDRAWQEPGVHVISLVAWGGVGKSALVDQWLNGLGQGGFRGAKRVFAWSFYKHGSGERAESAEEFFKEALRWFGDPDPEAGTATQKSERLVDLVRQQRALLVLDGLEPLQYPPGPQGGRLKDQALAVLLKELAAANPGLCVITTRETVAELASKAGTTAPRIDLDHLSPEAGAEVLKRLGVKGLERELEEASREFGGHALALTLLGSCLRDTCAGDVRRRHEVRVLEQDAEQYGHAEQVMAFYEKWFDPRPEGAVLRLLGLFDRPANREALAALRAMPPIPGLTEPLFRKIPGQNGAAEPLADAEFARVLARLRKAGLLARTSPDNTGAVDTHPLVRTYFSRRLEVAHLEAWQEGNRRLYEYLRAAAPDLPDTIEEMLPLYTAVLHGCRAGRHEESLNEVYIRRIERGKKHYSTKTLGALGAELAALSGFFDRPWDQPTSGLTAANQAYVLAQTGFRLRALGRLAEAFAPMNAVLEFWVGQEAWVGAAKSAANLSELALTLGDLGQAVVYAERSVELADRSGDGFQRMARRTTLADAAHQAGHIAQAEALFQEAESIQERRRPEYPQLYSLYGYRYCDLLLGRIESTLIGTSPILSLENADRLDTTCREVRRRAKQFLAEKVHPSLLDIALYHLVLGRAYLAAHQVETFSPRHGSEGEYLDLAAHHLQHAVDGLRRAGQENHLPRGLLARAALRRVRRFAAGADADLAKVFEIAERGSMRLYVCDAHLESARLALTTRDPAATRDHYAKARTLVESTGYHRRDPEVAALAAALENDTRVCETDPTQRP
jgi:hypothetical protein